METDGIIQTTPVQLAAFFIIVVFSCNFSVALLMYFSDVFEALSEMLWNFLSCLAAMLQSYWEPVLKQIPDSGLLFRFWFLLATCRDIWLLVGRYDEVTYILSKQESNMHGRLLQLNSNSWLFWFSRSRFYAFHQHNIFTFQDKDKNEADTFLVSPRMFLTCRSESSFVEW